MKKVNLINAVLSSGRRAFLGMLVVLAATLTSCEKGCGPGNEPAPDPIFTECQTLVTVVPAGCATGEFNNLWFKLDNGEWLQPFENKTGISNVQAGERYLIGYEEMKLNRHPSNPVICQALPPTGKAIRIWCMTPVAESAPTCQTLVTARLVECSNGAWGNIWLQLADGSYLQPWNNATAITQLTPGAKYKIGYVPMVKDNRFNNGAICAAMPSDPKAWNPTVVSVECMEVAANN